MKKVKSEELRLLLVSRLLGIEMGVLEGKTLLLLTCFLKEQRQKEDEEEGEGERRGKTKDE